MKVGRNDLCPCGSGKKFKKCCAQKPVVQRRSFSHLNVKTGVSDLSKVSGIVSKHIDQTVCNPPPSLRERVSKSLKNKKREMQSKETPLDPGES